MNTSLLLVLSLAAMGWMQEPSPQEQHRPAARSGQGTSERSDNPASLKGCLKQLGGNWVLAADTGQTVSLLGDSSMLRAHDGRQIEVQGKPSADGSFHVFSVTRISDSCTSQRAVGGAASDSGQR
ncbi:MAG TPA: hypothetical protein VF532_01670 [Candidatus Angelobacter sp.]